MHDQARKLTKDFRDRYEIKEMSVLDVGSHNMNGDIRSLFDNYTGLDIKDGPNVDIVSKGPYNFGVPDKSYDVVLCNQTLEHVEDTHAFIKEIARVARKYVCIIVPAEGFGEHRYPVDCWRVYPDGAKFLFRIAGIKCLEAELYRGHSTAAGKFVDMMAVGKL